MLNNDLYRRLKSLFGDVGVSNQGAEAIFDSIETDDGEYWGRIREAGEQYNVDCPFCSDTRKRLYISYLYCTSVNNDGKHTRFGSGLAICFNETACMEDRENRRELRRRLMEADYSECEITPKQETRKGRAVPPKNMLSIASLPIDHKAVKYLLDRGIDAECATKHGMAYCPFAPAMPMAEDRLYIPIFDADGTTVGAQFRLLYTTDDKFPPKYWTLPGTKLSRTLYNIEHAIHEPWVVAVEGVFDALRLGDNGVAFFKNTLSARQTQLLKTHWRHIVLMPDVDIPKTERDKRTYERAMRSMDDLVEELRGNPSIETAVKIELSPDKDPADYTRDKLIEMIEEASCGRIPC